MTAVALWWLYIRPAAAERKLARDAARPPAGDDTVEVESAPKTATSGGAARPVESTEVDDLTRVYGIGPARATRLREAGIGTFAALAIVDAEQLRDILTEVGIGNADPSNWPEQASLAARGDWEALAALQDRIRAERG